MESRFVDRVLVTVIGGRGGNGIVSFRREAYVPKGGPDGGDGGAGGSVFIRVNRKLGTLADFTHGAIFRAGRGGNGGPANRTGARGDDRTLDVPPGTQVFDDDTGELLKDLDADGSTLRAASGGAAGRGNASFATASRRAPRFATKGEPGQERRLRLELKLIADVGLLGLPNAGKSTLLRAISSSRTRVGAYPFTTLHPSLGVVTLSPGHSLVVADLPGLVEGASEGAGLGQEFLRHVERNRVLLLLVAPDIEPSPPEQVELLRGELEAWSHRSGRDLNDLVTRTVLTKIDMLSDVEKRSHLSVLPSGCAAISAATGEGVKDLVESLFEIVRSAVHDTGEGKPL